ncbi:MAG: heparin lyase I family protein [Myxococcota bacterium]
MARATIVAALTASCTAELGGAPSSNPNLDVAENGQAPEDLSVTLDAVVVDGNRVTLRFTNPAAQGPEGGYEIAYGDTPDAIERSREAFPRLVSYDEKLEMTFEIEDASSRWYALFVRDDDGYYYTNSMSATHGGEGGGGGEEMGEGGNHGGLEGFVMPAPYDLIKGWDFEGLRGQEYDKDTVRDGLKLHHQHIPGLLPAVETAEDAAEVEGALNGFAVRLRAERNGSSNKETRRKYARGELQSFIDKSLVDPSRMGKESRGHYYYSRIGEDYVYQIRMKAAANYDIDNGAPKGPGQDLYASIIDLKQDHTGTPKRSRDATLRLRLYGEHVNIVINGDTMDGADYKQYNTHVNRRESVPVPQFFDGGYHTWTVRAKWHHSEGHLYVWLDDQLIWSDTNTTTCYRDDNHPDLGPYFKWGVYDAGFFAQMNSGSNEKEVLVDYALMGFYNPEGKGWTKYSEAAP